MHGNIAFKMPALKGSIVRPESIINSLNQVIAVNWMTSSKGEKQERNSLHWSYVLYNCKIKSKISINNNINFKLRYDRRSGYWNLSNCKLTWKKISTSRGFKPMAIFVRAAVLYQLSYEDPYIGSRPICWVHLNPWLE